MKICLLRLGNSVKQILFPVVVPLALSRFLFEATWSGSVDHFGRILSEMTSVDSLRLLSYNCRGWNSGQHSVCDLFQSCDICLIQEHWLLHEQLSLLSVNNDFLSCSMSGMDSSDLLLGRPFGGCAIFFRKSLLPFVSCLDSPSKRFCCVIGMVPQPSWFVFTSLTMMAPLHLTMNT